MFGRRKKEDLEDMFAGGGASLTQFQDTYRKNRKFPKSFHSLIQYMVEMSLELRNMIEKDIPRTFPQREPIVHYDNRYKHSNVERLNAVPLNRLSDVDSAIEICLKLKEIVSATRDILADFFPKRMDGGMFQTEMEKNNFGIQIEKLDNFMDSLNKIQDELLKRKGSTPIPTIDYDNLEKLRNHIIRIGYDRIKYNKDLIELYPNVFSTQHHEQRQIQHNQQGDMPPPQQISTSDSKIERLALDLSDRLKRNMGR